MMSEQEQEREQNGNKKRTGAELVSDCFNFKLTQDEIASMGEDEISSLFAPSSYRRVHDGHRSVIIDIMTSLFIRYYNLREANRGYYIVSRDSIMPIMKKMGFRSSARRYIYNGWDSGMFAGDMDISDRYFRFRVEKGKSCICDSIPNWNIAHFFCDYINTDAKSDEFVEWVFSNRFWETKMKSLMLHNFVKKTAK